MVKYTLDRLDLPLNKMSGRTPWNKGISPTDEVKRRISSSSKNRVISQETRKRMSESQKDRRKKEKGLCS